MNILNRVFRRRAELVAEYGFDAYQVTADGVTVDGFTVVGYFPERGDVTLEKDTPPRTFIRWTNDADRRRAAEAIRGDWEETIGPEATAQYAKYVETVRITEGWEPVP